jgi:hypothetical protein
MYELQLPSGNQVTFRAPRNIDRKRVVEQFLNKNEKGTQTDIELLSSYCLASQNGQQLIDPDPRTRMDQWELKDVQFYQGVFLELFFMNDEDDMKKVKEAAKKLLEPGTESN